MILSSRLVVSSLRDLCSNFLNLVQGRCRDSDVTADSPSVTVLWYLFLCHRGCQESGGGATCVLLYLPLLLFSISRTLIDKRDTVCYWHKEYVLKLHVNLCVQYLFAHAAYDDWSYNVQKGKWHMWSLIMSRDTQWESWVWSWIRLELSNDIWMGVST